ncbi:MAG: hypothetical protein GC200_10780 [Tepidisphaera sp.]|nr:hypothetical protein [Tepidisphaera sp.]
MSPCRCQPPRARGGWFRRGLGNFFGWAGPSLLLALIPKCPFCVAGYVALWTGLGISLTTAAWLRTGLIILCVTSLALMAVFHVRKLISLSRTRAATFAADPRNMHP